jgi:HK97 family phage prohead protease
MSERDRVVLEVKYATGVGVDIPGRTVEGYASTWAVDELDDAFARTAWDEALASTPLSAIGVHWMHQDGEIPLGTVRELVTDDHGLRFKVAVLDSPRGMELLGYLKHALAQGMAPGVSVGYRTLSSALQRTGHRTVRVIQRALLREISFAPAGVQANAGAVVLGVKTQDAPAHGSPEQVARYRHELALLALDLDLPPPLAGVEAVRAKRRWHEAQIELAALDDL